MRMGLSRRRFNKLYIFVPVMMVFIYIILLRLQPTFLSLAHQAANNMINSCVNEVIAKEFENYSINSFYIENGNTFISDVTSINTVKANIISKLQKELGDSDIVKIPIGSASGVYLLNSLGFKIPVRITPSNIITADFENTFESAGINFVRHTIYIRVSVDVNYRGFIMNETETIVTRIPVIENITSGEVPQYYGAGMGIIENNSQ